MEMVAATAAAQPPGAAQLKSLNPGKIRPVRRARAPGLDGSIQSASDRERRNRIQPNPRQIADRPGAAASDTLAQNT